MSDTSLQDRIYVLESVCLDGQRRALQATKDYSALQEEVAATLSKLSFLNDSKGYLNKTALVISITEYKNIIDAIAATHDQLETLTKRLAYMKSFLDDMEAAVEVKTSELELLKSELNNLGRLYDFRRKKKD